MSYSNAQGSVIVPTASIIPCANLSTYGYSTPSGFVYCNGCYYATTDALYINLYNAIGFTYGRVDVKIDGQFNADGSPKTYPCFRVPNLMNTNSYNYSYNIPGYSYYSATPNYIAGIQYTTVAGTTAPANRVVNTTTTISTGSVNYAGFYSGSGAYTIPPGFGTPSGATTTISVPVTPSFVMPYLIKL